MERYNVTEDDRQAWAAQKKREDAHIDMCWRTKRRSSFRVAGPDWNNPQGMHVSTYASRAAYMRQTDKWEGPDGRLYGLSIYEYPKSEQPKLHAMAREVGAQVWTSPEHKLGDTRSVE